MPLCPTAITLCIAKTLGTSLENYRARDLLPSSTAVTGKNTNIGTCTTCLAGGLWKFLEHRLLRLRVDFYDSNSTIKVH